VAGGQWIGVTLRGLAAFGRDDVSRVDDSAGLKGTWQADKSRSEGVIR